MRRLDIIGLKIGKLTAIQFLRLNNHNSAIWAFHCECGNFCSGLSSVFRKGNKKSCGCLRRKYKNPEEATRAKRLRERSRKQTEKYKSYHKKYIKKYRESEEGRSRIRKYYLKRRPAERARLREGIKNLSDAYVVCKLKSQFGKDAVITQRMIDLKREQLIMHREIVKTREVLNGTS